MKLFSIILDPVLNQKVQLIQILHIDKYFAINSAVSTFIVEFVGFRFWPLKWIADNKLKKGQKFNLKVFVSTFKKLKTLE